MSVSVTIRKYLVRKGGQYKVRCGEPMDSLESTAAAANIPLERLAKATLLCDGQVHVLAVYPADQSLDLESISARLKRTFRACSAEVAGRLFHDCAAEALPPIGEPYGVRVIVDKGLDELDEVYFATGQPGNFIRSLGGSFDLIHKESLRGLRLTRVHDTTAPAEADAAGEGGQRAWMRAQVEKVDSLPAMPGIAAEIARLRDNPYVNASELASVIEQDPSLSAQLLRYATSPFYGYQGNVDSVETAIVRVLGMDFVMDFAFGLSLGRSFTCNTRGPIGVDAFWQHALHTASLTQALCNRIDYSRRPSAGTAYLAGLLHNFGFLLLGHLFEPQFKRLNDAVAAEPDRSIAELEDELLAMKHTELGLWLMDAWDMPRELTEAVREHHNADFRSDFSVYANLVYVANALLKRYGIGDADSMEIPPQLLESLGLDDERVEAALAAVMEGHDGLEFMASKMAA